MREKYDLSLDSRQVVSLLIGGIVVLGAVFVLGVLVGKKLSAVPRTDRAPDLLTALDHRSDALEQARATPPLTFQEELTRPTPPTPAVTKAPAAPASSPPPVAAAAAPPARAQAASRPPAPVAAAEPRPQPEHKAAPERKPDASPAETTRATPAEAVVTRSTPTAAHPGPKPPDVSAAGGPFTLQLGASPDRDVAERQAARLREKGYAPYIISAEVPGKGTWYRVRMGSFPTKDAASRYLQDFKRETQAEAFVASTR